MMDDGEGALQLVEEVEPSSTGRVYFINNLHKGNVYKIIGDITITGNSSSQKGMLIGYFNGEGGTGLNGLLQKKEVIDGDLTIDYEYQSSGGAQRYICKSPEVGTSYNLIEGLISTKEDVRRLIKFDTSTVVDTVDYGNYKFDGFWNNTWDEVISFWLFVTSPQTVSGTLKVYKVV